MFGIISIMKRMGSLLVRPSHFSASTWATNGPPPNRHERGSFFRASRHAAPRHAVRESEACDATLSARSDGSNRHAGPAPRPARPVHGTAAGWSAMLAPATGWERRGGRYSPYQTLAYAK